MKRMLFNATYQGELRVATVDGQRLLDFEIETDNKLQRRGNIYKAVVTRVEHSLEACFVDYGVDKQGFLPFKDIDPAYVISKDGEETRIKDINKITTGTELVIQVEKDERGNKGAAVTTYITLPGRYLVLMPNNSKSGGVSRRIDGEEREELKALMSQLNIPAGMSIILRTAALGREIQELEWDLTYLVKLWTAVKNASNQNTGSFLIYHESSLVIRSIRDHFTPDIVEILVDTEEVYGQARSFMNNVIPNFVNKIKLYKNEVPLFSRFQVEHQIQSAYSREVTLPSGGVIVIDQGEALTAVDVNSAKANKGSDIEMTALNTNMEAATELARQLRLRDLAGLVVVDFIDMENPKNERDLEVHFKHQLSVDKARIQIGKISKFGLLELSRQRLKSSLEETNRHTCPRCNGLGTIRAVESNALHILRLIEEDAIKNNSLSALHVQLPVEVATYLLNERRDDVIKIENNSKVKVVLIPNIYLDSPNYKIRKVTKNNEYVNEESNTASYNLVDVEEYIETSVIKPKQAKALVQNVGHEEPAPTKSKGVFNDILEKINDFFKPKAQIIKPHLTEKTLESNKNTVVNNNLNTKPYVARNNKQSINKEEYNKPNTLRANIQQTKTIEKPAQIKVNLSEEPRVRKNKPPRVDTIEKVSKPQEDMAPKKESIITLQKELEAIVVITKDIENTAQVKIQGQNNRSTKSQRPEKSQKNRPQYTRGRSRIINDSSTTNKCNVANNVAQTIFISSFNGGISINTVSSSAPVRIEDFANSVKVNSSIGLKTQILDTTKSNLELVSTNPELIKNLKKIEPLIDTTSKKYNDIATQNRKNIKETTYSQVETSN